MKRMIALLLAAAMLAACFAAFAEEEAAEPRHTGLQVLDVSEAFFPATR